MCARFLSVAASAALSFATAAQAQPARAPRPAPVLSLGAVVDGELTPLDTRRPSGKFEDAFRIEGRRGQRIDLRLESTDFDPMLLVTGPGGFQMSNDDAAGAEGAGAFDSRLVIELPADGAYRVSATSLAPGAMGAYRLRTMPVPAGARTDAPLAAAPLAPGAALSGRLARDDAQIAGKYLDRYRFTARRGQRIRASLTSPEFDTVLAIEGPDGSTNSSDDTRRAGRVSTDSLIDAVMAEDGDYILTVTSYRPGTTGKYHLSFQDSPGNPRHANLAGRVLVVAVGVSDYERMSDLANTDEDATQLLASLRTAGLLHPQSVALTNSGATTAALRAALGRAASAAGPDDLILFFYSGHGDQVDVPRSAAELDGRTETIELFDAAMTDAQLQPMIDRLGGRMVLVALDSCFSGGFRNLVNRQNVMGLFSSEEDLTSLVAARLGAGGYLSYYLRMGLAGEADEDGDRIITAGELSNYLRRRFRLGGDIPATTREDEGNFQHLLVERGGVHVDDGLVRLRPVQQAAAATAASPSGTRR